MGLKCTNVWKVGISETIWTPQSPPFILLLFFLYIAMIKWSPDQVVLDKFGFRSKPLMRSTGSCTHLLEDSFLFYCKVEFLVEWALNHIESQFSMVFEVSKPRLFDLYRAQVKAFGKRLRVWGAGRLGTCHGFEFLDVCDSYMSVLGSHNFGESSSVAKSKYEGGWFACSDSSFTLFCILAFMRKSQAWQIGRFDH